MRLIIVLLSIFFSEIIFAQGNFSIQSNSFNNGKKIPNQYTCLGADISPPISWSNIPAKTQSLVLIVSDPDAPLGTWYHWVVFNIPPTATGFKENIQDYPANTIVGNSSYNKNRYNGPCPPPGKLHHYLFTLYALNTKMPFPAGTDAKVLQDAMKKNIIGTTELTGLFER